MLPEKYVALAKKKSHASSALEKQWTIACERLVSIGLPDADAELLFVASSSPGILNRVCKFFSGDAPAALREILEYCDDSPHDLAQWLSSLDKYCGWMEEHSRPALLKPALGYVSCSSAASPNSNLPWVVGQMLEQYGVE